MSIRMMVMALLGAAALGAQAADYRTIDEFQYPSAEALRAAYVPMAGSLDVSVVELDGRPALRMPVRFQGTETARASWDHKVSLDLAAAQGVRFEFLCRDAAPVSHFNIYFHSGSGWYGATIADTTPGRWSTVVVKKTGTWVEDQPAGWGRVDCIRLSAWRLCDGHTEFYIAGLGVVGENASIAVIRADSAASAAPGESRTAVRCAETIGQYLDDLGLDYTLLSDADVNAKRLEKTQIAILPYSPSAPDAMVKALDEFIAGGGKFVSFYTIPTVLRARAGIDPGSYLREERPGQFSSIRPAADGLGGMPAAVGQVSGNITVAKPIGASARVVAYWHDPEGQSTGKPALIVSETCAFMTHIVMPGDDANKRRMLMAMLGHFAPGCWEEAVAWRLDRMGRLASFQTFDEVRWAIESSAETREAKQALEKAVSIRARAAALVEQKKYPEAMAAAEEAGEALKRAYAAAQRPEKGEHRAFWCHNAFGVEGLTWNEAIRILAENGFTAILPNMCWGGTAYYRSEVLPVAPEVQEKGDQIEACLAACKKYGVECHVWKVNWNTGGRAPSAFIEKIKREGRTQVTFDGKAEDRWLCPSSPANQQLEIDAMVEVATKYDVDGVHFDYIRYPDSNSCFCTGCRKRFEQYLGAKVANWPADVRAKPDLQQAWFEFRRRQITAVVKGVHDKLDKAKPDVEISAAVFNDWPTHRDTIGQDTKLWCDEGYLDFVCPMDYTADSGNFKRLVQEQKAWFGKVPCYPGIGLSVWPDPSDIARLIEQIDITRKLNMGGFTVFNYGVNELSQMVPLCGLGITRRAQGDRR
ncbi:MAG TPA: family 10 glycosylhydrolase [Candidatus Hydrogenedentes bacterium]|nr:family 10 glycosylhydrolase [Candidatus Hydrogenedentota bacterium]HPG66830.1 family 10 glycosylhydrolase [Candidatus Hydrogenedentota bacterium]